MKTFAFQGLDRPDGGPLRAAVREDHRAHIRACPPGIRCILGGPLRAPDDAMIGTLLVFEAADAERVASFMRADPYVRADLFEAVSLWEWTIGLGAIVSDGGENGGSAAAPSASRQVEPDR